MTTDPIPPRAADALPARPPRPLVVHFGVDSAVAFLALVVLGLIFGVPWGITAAVALVIGAVACRYTHRAEVRALAQRRQPAPEPPPA
ncbi:MAG TPA: hypothetical protein VK549_12675 [Acidimicrobiia bacterium]|nr:hypothetical protein [Acidimicrobiia bacterium]